GVRLWVMLRAPQAELAANLRRYYMVGVGNDHLTVRAIKEYMDGALGSRGAWLLQPYSDLPEDAPNRSGINVEPVAEIRKTGTGHRQRFSTLHPRDRGPGESRSAESVRSGF